MSDIKDMPALYHHQGVLYVRADKHEKLIDEVESLQSQLATLKSDNARLQSLTTEQAAEIERLKDLFPTVRCKYCRKEMKVPEDNGGIYYCSYECKVLD